MYDTIEIISPYLSDVAILDIKNKAYVTQTIDMETGEIMYQVTTSQLKGSYDSRLSIRVLGNRVKIAGSVHKFILGHNVFGGPKDIKMCCRYLVALVNKRLDVQLPNWSQWEMSRIDIAHVFNLGNSETIHEFMKMLRGCRYPRRKCNNYGMNTYYFAGSSTSIKIYQKGPEFRAHDKKRMLNNPGIWDNRTIEFLEKMANQLLRCEVEVRRRKFKYDKKSLFCSDLDDKYLENIYIQEVNKIMKEGKQDMEIVRDILGVKERLNAVYSKRKANNLFAVWSRIQIEGEETVRNSVSRMTYYRYRKELTTAGISLQGCLDVIEMPIKQGEMARIYDFVPLPGERNHVGGIFCDIEEAIRQLELAG